VPSLSPHSTSKHPNTHTERERPDPNQRTSGPPLPRALRRTTRPIHGLRIARRALRRPVHQPDQKRHPQHLRPTHRPQWPRRPRGLLRRAQPHIPLAHQASNPRARAAGSAVLHLRADIAGHHSRNRALGSNVRRSARGYRRRRDHDHAPVQRNAPAAPPQPGHLRAARHGLALALQHADGHPRRAEAVLRPHRRRHPLAPDVRQDRVERAPGRLRPGHRRHVAGRLARRDLRLDQRVADREGGPAAHARGLRRQDCGLLHRARRVRD